MWGTKLTLVDLMDRGFGEIGVLILSRMMRLRASIVFSNSYFDDEDEGERRTRTYCLEDTKNDVSIARNETRSNSFMCMFVLTLDALPEVCFG